MTTNIKNSRYILRNMQDIINEELKSNIDELNQIGTKYSKL